MKKYQELEILICLFDEFEDVLTGSGEPSNEDLNQRDDTINDIFA